MSLSFHESSADNPKITENPNETKPKKKKIVITGDDLGGDNVIIGKRPSEAE